MHSVRHPGGFPNEFPPLLQGKPCMSTIRGRLGAVSNWCSRSQHEQNQELHTGSTLALPCLRVSLPLPLAYAFPVSLTVLSSYWENDESNVHRRELYCHLVKPSQEVAVCHHRRCRFAWIPGVVQCCVLMLRMCPILQTLQLLWGSKNNKILLDLHEWLYLFSGGRGYIQKERVLLLLQAA